MIAPTSVTAPPAPDQAGLWCELHDKDGKLLYHRVLHHSLGYDTEVFSQDPAQSVHRISNPQDHGVFDVIVPDLPDAHSVAIVGPHHPSARLRGGPARHELSAIPENVTAAP